MIPSSRNPCRPSRDAWLSKRMAWQGRDRDPSTKVVGFVRTNPTKVDRGGDCYAVGFEWQYSTTVTEE